MSDVVSLIEGTEEERNELLDKKGEFCIHIISSSLTEWLYGRRNYLKPPKYWLNKNTPSYDLIIVDECSQFKSPKSIRFKSLKKLSENKSLFLLSGTPFSNIKKEGKTYKNADELYYAFYLLGLYSGSLTQFRTEFCFLLHWDKYSWRMTEEVYDSLIERLAQKSIRKKLDLDIKLVETPVYCNLDHEKLQQLKNTYYLETDNLKQVTAANKAVMINKTLQLSNGFLYGEAKEVIRINTYKFEKLKELLNGIQDNILIFYNFQEDKDFLLKNLSGSKSYETDQDKQDWNAGKIKYLILSPFSEKYGLNLQEGGHTIIWFGLVWSAESYQQSNARLYRRGQKHSVNVYYLMAKNSFDEYVYKQLVLKKETMDDFITYIER
jgi:SNF2 family DNA or RNA helicase